MYCVRICVARHLLCWSIGCEYLVVLDPGHAKCYFSFHGNFTDIAWLMETDSPPTTQDLKITSKIRMHSSCRQYSSITHVFCLTLKCQTLPTQILADKDREFLSKEFSTHQSALIKMDYSRKFTFLMQSTTYCFVKNYEQTLLLFLF